MMITMRQHILLLLLLPLIICCGATSAGDFSRAEIWILQDAARRNQTLSQQSLPSGKAPALKVTWDEAAFSYLELQLQSPGKIPGNFLKGLFSLELHFPSDAQLRSVSLRLLDATGETFQFSVPCPPRTAAGVKTFDFSVDTTKPHNAAWGGNKDKKMDLPLSIKGVTIDFLPKTGPGEVYFAGLHLFSEPLSTTEEEKTLSPVDFGNVAQWGLVQSEIRSQTLVEADRELQVGWDAGKHNYFELYLLKPQLLPKFKKARFSLRTKIPNDKKIRQCSLRLRDASGEIFHFPKSLPPADQYGLRTIEYDVDPADLKNFGSWGGDKNKKLDFPVSLLGFTGDFATGYGTGEMIFSGLSMTASGVKQPPLSDLIAMEIETGNPVHVLRAGEEKVLKIQFHNHGTEHFQRSALVEFEDFYGNTFSEKIPLIDLAPGKSCSIPVQTPLPALGHWNVRARLTAPGQAPFSISRTFAYMNPSGPTPGRAKGFLWGISSHPQLHPPASQRIEALAAALVGAKVVREDVYWHRVQPARGQWDFRSFDQTVEIFGEQNIEIAAILCYTAPWAVRDKSSKRPDKSEPEPEAWSQFCSEMAKRYRGKVHFYEVWNEPDVTPFSNISPTAYAGMLRNAYKSVKTTNPEAIVLTGGFATLTNHPMLIQPDYQEQALRLGKGAFDIHAYHEHHEFYPRFVQMVDGRFLPMRQRVGVTEPWWANETAMTSSNGRERQQAKALYKKLLFAWSRGAIGYNWYDLRNDGNDPSDNEHNYGMLTTDFYPKPVYSVYNTLVTLFRDKEFSHQIKAGELDYLFLFRDEEEMVLAAWNETGVTLPIVLGTDAESAEIVDLMNNRRAIPVLNGRILLELGIVPQSLRLPKAARVEYLGDFVNLAVSDLAVPGADCRVNIQLTNPLKHSAEFHLNLTTPSGFRPRNIERKLTVPGGQTLTSLVNLQVDDDFKPVFGTPLNLQANYRLSNSAYQGQIAVPVKVAQVIPASPSKNRDADFTLENRRQVHEIYATDPSKTHLNWKGPEDLSGRVWLGRDKDNLLLRVSVTDDVHHQPQRNEMTWMGDNVQVSMQLPDQDGLWELGLTRLADGAPDVWCWAAPSGWNAAQSAGQIKLTTSRNGNETGYVAQIPFDAVGLNPAILKAGFRFNLLINDNDGEIRKNWIHIAPGIGLSKDPAQYPFVIFR
ncbi:beta-1,4-xylanase [Opitutaceae bacterium TAV1]|nr:beta-1,4-xylanase [Opitutaceae bacterium TAV1]